MWRFAYRAMRAVTFAQYWIQRRFSRAGVFVLGATVLAAALGADTNQTVAYQIFTLLASLLLVAFVAGIFRRPAAITERALPRVVTAGEAFSYSVRIRNRGNRTLEGLSYLEGLADPRPSFEEFRSRLKFPTYRGFWRLTRERQIAEIDETPVPKLAPHGDITVKVQGRAWRRGLLHFETAVAAGHEALGLFRGLAASAQPQNLISLPRRYALPAIAFPGTRKYQPGGVSLAISLGDSEEFVGLRDYRPGDPLQRVHWKSFARTGSPVVKEYQDEFFARQALVLDTFGGPEALADFEEAVSLAASFAYTVDTQESLLDLLFVGDKAYCYTAGRGQVQTAALLQVLAGVKLAPGSRIPALHDAVMARSGGASGCTLIFIAWDEARRALADAVRAQGLPLLAILVSARVFPGVPAWVHRIEPGKVQQGLAHLASRLS